jgi:hypothetical protein
MGCSHNEDSPHPSMLCRGVVFLCTWLHYPNPQVLVSCYGVDFAYAEQYYSLHEVECFLLEVNLYVPQNKFPSSQVKLSCHTKKNLSWSWSFWA